MSNYADAVAVTTPTLTARERTMLLRVSGEHAKHYRDHVIFSVALGTGLRCFEVAALNVSDIFDEGTVRDCVQLRVAKRSNSDMRTQHVWVPPKLALKLAKFYRWKIERGQSVAGDAPLFVSQKAGRIATRTLRISLKSATCFARSQPPGSLKAGSRSASDAVLLSLLA